MTFVQYEAGLVCKYVGVDWTARTPYAKDDEAMFSLLFNRRVHKDNTEPALVCAPVLLISTKY